MKKVAIVIVLYNTSNLITKQIECLRKFCEDDFDIIVIDNSNAPDKIEAIAYWCSLTGVRLIKVQATETDGSQSNAFACNTAYALLKDQYSYFYFTDHDTFAIKKFSVVGTLEGKVIAGLEQTKSKSYFQQTSLMFNNDLIDHSLIDFSINREYGLDTGGNLYKVIEKYGRDACVFFDEKYYQNPFFRHPPYDFYVTINKDTFMHFINGSGWNPQAGQEERINSLMNILDSRVNGE